AAAARLTELTSSYIIIQLRGYIPVSIRRRQVRHGMPLGEDPVDQFREVAIDRLRALAGQRAPFLAGRDAVLVGLAGRGIQASRSPIMHEREGARLGIPFRYVLIDFD